MKIIDSVYDSHSMQPEDVRKNNVELQVDEEKLAMPQFKELWKRISPKSVYVVDFDTDELVSSKYDVSKRISANSNVKYDLIGKLVEETVKHTYFVAETKGSMSSMQLRLKNIADSRNDEVEEKLAGLGPWLCFIF